MALAASRACRPAHRRRRRRRRISTATPRQSTRTGPSRRSPRNTGAFWAYVCLTVAARRQAKGLSRLPPGWFPHLTLERDDREAAAGQGELARRYADLPWIPTVKPTS